jgi:hypothetical protein
VQSIPRAVALFTVVTLVPLLVWDMSPRVFPAGAHDVLAAAPLALIGIACHRRRALRGGRLPRAPCMA